jgi:hypothetical protein
MCITWPRFGGAFSCRPEISRSSEKSPGMRPGLFWLEGINDFGTAKAAAEEVIEGVREGVKRLRARIPGVRIVMATLTSSLHAVNNTHGTPEVEQKRQAFNTFVRGAGIFDAIVDFDKVTIDPKTGELKGRIPTQFICRRSWRQAPPQPAGLSGHGQCLRPRVCDR